MAGTALTENYTPRVSFNTEYGIEHPMNDDYVTSVSKWLMQRIKKSAQPYSQKHKGVKDTGKPGKKVEITLEELKQKVRDTKGVDPNGIPIYWGPTTLMSQSGKAIKLGLMTEDENQRKPSADRLISKDGHYTNDNVQITTKTYNLGKSNSNGSTNTSNVTIKVGKVDILLENCSPQYLAAYTQSLAA
jgi:hypothetical protein